MKWCRIAGRPYSCLLGHAFELTRMDSKMKKYIVCASSAEEKKKWMEAIMHHHKEIINLERSKEVLLVSPRGSTADFTR